VGKWVVLPPKPSPLRAPVTSGKSKKNYRGEWKTVYQPCRHLSQMHTANCMLFIWKKRLVEQTNSEPIGAHHPPPATANVLIIVSMQLGVPLDMSIRSTGAQPRLHYKCVIGRQRQMASDDSRSEVAETQDSRAERNSLER